MEAKRPRRCAQSRDPQTALRLREVCEAARGFRSAFGALASTVRLCLYLGKALDNMPCSAEIILLRACLEAVALILEWAAAGAAILAGFLFCFRFPLQQLQKIRHAFDMGKYHIPMFLCIQYRSNVFLPASYAVTGKKNHTRIFSSNLRSAHPMIATRYPLMSVDPRKWVGTPALCSFACNRSL